MNAIPDQQATVAGDPRRSEGDWQLHPVFDATDRKQMKRTGEDIALHQTGAERRAFCAQRHQHRARPYALAAAVRAARRGDGCGVAVAQAAKDLDVHENVLRKWVRELRKAPQEAFPGNGKQTVQEAEIARLLKEVAKLKMERDILKRAAAHFAKESM